MCGHLAKFCFNWYAIVEQSHRGVMRMSGAERKGPLRRWCLTLPSNGLSPEKLGCSPASLSVGPRFSCLQEVVSSEEENCSSETPFESVLEVLDDEPPEKGWMTIVSRGRRSDDETAQDFRNEIGYPMPASRFWERSLSLPPEEMARDWTGSRLQTSTRWAQ